MGRLHAAMGRWFSKIGVAVANRPKTVIVLSVTICFVLFLGFPFLAKTEWRADRLWAPQDSQAVADRDIYATLFGQAPRIARVVVTARDGDDILTQPALAETLALHERIVSFDDNLFQRECARSTLSRQCLVSTALEAFNYNLSILSSSSQPNVTLVQYFSDPRRVHTPLATLLGGASMPRPDVLEKASGLYLRYWIPDNVTGVFDDQFVSVVQEFTKASR